MRNFFIQGMLVSVLATQFIAVLSMVVADKESPAAVAANSNMLRSLYPRSAELKQAPLPEKETAVDAAGSPRGQRCVKCGGGYGYGNYGNYYGNYADRYYDDYYYSNRDRGAYYGNYGREDPYYNRDPYYAAQRDRNWYYQPDKYGYDRSPYDRNYYNRYDDRYYGRTNPYDYGRTNPYDTDPYYQNNYNSYRGNGYDNLNPQYYEAMREQFNQRGRTYGYNDYDRYYDRPAYRGYYDNRNFRPYDETYRGTAGFDLSGRGYYFANQPPPPPQYPPPYEQYPNFIDNNKLPPPPSNHHQYSPHSPSVIQPEFYQGKPAQSPSSSSTSSNSHTQTVSSSAIGVDSGGGSGSSSNNKNNNKESLDNKDKISTAYGGRPQSLGSSYLFERTDDANLGSGLNPPAGGIGEKKQESANLEMKSE